MDLKMSLKDNKESSKAFIITTNEGAFPPNRIKVVQVVVVAMLLLVTFQFFGIRSSTKVVLRELEIRRDDRTKIEELMKGPNTTTIVVRQELWKQKEHDANHTQEIIKLKEQVAAAGQQNQVRNATTPAAYNPMENTTRGSDLLIDDEKETPPSSTTNDTTSGDKLNQGNVTSSYAYNGTSPYAYVFVSGGAQPEEPSTYHGYLYNILIAATILRELGSTSDIVAYFQLSVRTNATSLPSNEVAWLKSAGVKIRYLPKDHDENMIRLIMRKYEILKMTEYRRVFLLDSDALPLSNLDYLFHLSDGPNPRIKPNIIVASTNVPFCAGFFMVAPYKGAWERAEEIVLAQRVDAFKKGILFDYYQGFGQPIVAPDYWSNKFGRKSENWTWYGVNMDMGFGYHWAKYERKAATILMHEHAENWGPGPNGTVQLEGNVDIRQHIKPIIHDGFACRKYRCDIAHFDGGDKPWTKGPPAAFQTKEEGMQSSHHLWFHYLNKLNDRLYMGLNFSDWVKWPHRPLGFAVGHALRNINREAAIQAGIINETGVNARRHRFL